MTESKEESGLPAAFKRVEKRDQHQNREAARDERSTEADQKIYPSKMEAEVASHAAGSVSSTCQPARPEKTEPETRLGDHELCDRAAGVTEKQEREQEEKGEDERRDEPAERERQRTEGRPPDAVGELLLLQGVDREDVGPVAVGEHVRRPDLSIPVAIRRTPEGILEPARAIRPSGHGGHASTGKEGLVGAATAAERLADAKLRAAATTVAPAASRLFQPDDHGPGRFVSDRLTTLVPQREQVVQNSGEDERTVERDPNQPAERAPDRFRSPPLSRRLGPRCPVPDSLPSGRSLGH